MAKVFPRRSMFSPFLSFGRKTFTVWMKSLVCHTNGCTVFDSNGDIVYRVENYGKKSSNSEVCLMDLGGRVLVTLQRKRLRIMQHWCGYRFNGDIRENKEKPWFQVRKCFRIFMGNSGCQVKVGYDKKYWVVKLARKAAFRIVDIDGDTVAEVKQKQSSTGIILGEDVLTLVVQPNIDHSLVMAIVVVYGLMNYKM